jgi:hypothetical protein
MRRFWTPALLAVPLLTIPSAGSVSANPPGTANFGCAGYCFKLFPHMHQHGPLFNYGPYYGYYPFAPYGPWDAYLRYDPNFYGGAGGGGGGGFGGGGKYGCGKHGCGSGGFLHASWLHGGWFSGHTWLTGGHGHKSGCTSCSGAVAVAPRAVPTGSATARLDGFGDPAQSAAFYSATPTLDPTLELVPVSGQTK